jgi:hypothetical protein
MHCVTAFNIAVFDYLLDELRLPINSTNQVREPNGLLCVVLQDSCWCWCVGVVTARMVQPQSTYLLPTADWTASNTSSAKAQTTGWQML